MAGDEEVGTAIIRLVVDESGVQGDIDRSLGGIQGKAGDQGTKAGKQYGQNFNKAAQTEFKPLITAITQLGPALIPLAGGAAAVGAAFIGAGAAAGAAFLGIKADITAANAQGRVFKTGIDDLNDSLKRTEQNSANALGGTFLAGMAILDRQMPSINNELLSFDGTLGSIGLRLETGILAVFKDLGPTINTVLASGDKVAAKFESWATGEGGTKFAATLTADFKEAAPVVDELATAAVHLVSALAPIGSTSLTEIGLFSTVISHLPTGAITAFTDAYIVFKATSLVTGPLLAASAALEKYAIATKGVAAAEDEEAAAGKGGLLGRSLGGASSALSLLAPVAAAYIGLTLAATTASNATAGWADSFDRSARVVQGTSTVTKDVLTLNFGAAGKAIDGIHKESATLADDQLDVKSYTDTMANLGSTVGDTKSGFNYAIEYTENLSAAQIKAADAARVCTTEVGTLTNAQIIGSARAASYADAMASVSKATDIANHSIDAAPITQAAAGYSQLQDNVQKNVDTMLAGVNAGQKTVTTINGIKIGNDAYNKALAQSNGNVDKAIGLLEGQTAAIRTQQSAINTTITQQTLINKYTTDAQSNLKLTTSQVDLYTEALGYNAASLDTSAAAESEAYDALAKLSGQLANGSTAMNTWLAAVDQFNQDGPTAASTAKLIGSALVAANGDALSYAQTMVGAATANQQLVTDFTAATKATVTWKTGVIDFHNAAAAPLINDLQSLQTAAMNAAEATYQHEKSIGVASAATDAYNVYVNDTSGALQSESKQLGITKGDAKNLSDQYFGMPKNVKTQIEQAGAGSVTSLLQGILSDLNKLANPPPIKITADPTQALYSIAQVKSSLATLPSTASAGEVQAITKGEEEARGAFGMIMKSYAGGGIRESHNPAIYSAKPGTVRVFAEPETGGEAYIPLANDSRRAGAKAIASKTVSMLGGTAQFESGGFTGVTSSGNVTSAASAAAKVASTTEKAAEAAAKKSAATRAADLKNLDAYIPKLIADAKSATAAASVVAGVGYSVQVYAGQLSKGLGAQLKAENKVLTAEALKRQSVTVQLASANAKLVSIEQSAAQELASVKSTFINSFDISSAGSQQNSNGQYTTSYGSILASATQQANIAKEFAADLITLHHEGIDASLVAGLAQAGPSMQTLAQAKALVGISKTQVAALNATQTSIAASGQTAGTAASVSLYYAGEQAALGLVNGLKSQQAALTKQMTSLADAMVGQIKKDLKIKSPSQVFHDIGLNAGKGLHSGLTASRPLVASAAAGLSASAVGGATAGLSGGNSDIAAALMAIANRPIILQVDSVAIAKANNTGSKKLARLS